jgi:phage terminase large subunit GpA-like protein
MGAPDAFLLVSDAWREGLELDPVLTVPEWADANRILSKKVAAEPGEWRTSRVPFMREPMELLSVTSPVQDVVIVAGTQVAKTETGNNWLGYTVDHVPGPFLEVQPTLQLAKRWSRQRLAEMIESTLSLREKVAEKRSRDSANTIWEKEFSNGAFVVCTGANSAVGLRSMPARYIHFDEVDAYPQDVDGEGDPIGLATNRQDTFGLRAKRLYTSTPTEKDASAIQALYDASDRRRYYLKCPHCGHEQPLEFEDADGRRRLVWPDDQPEHAAYLCGNDACGRLIAEHHKFDMLEGGRWIAEAPGANKAAGFRINSLYSPWLTWAKLAREYVEAKLAEANGNVSKLKKFVNTRLALVWERSGDRVKANALVERWKKDPACEYRLGTVPMGGLALTAAVDVQADRLEFKVIAWGLGEEWWVADHRVFYGDTNEDEPWNELVEILRQPLRNAWGHDLYIRACAVDTGYNTQRVYAFVRDHAHLNVFGVKGMPEVGKPVLGKRRTVDFDWRGVQIKDGVVLFPVGTYAAKEQLMGWLKLTGRGTHRGHFSRELPLDYFDQLTAERLVTSSWAGGKEKRIWWKPKGARNEALDLMVYNMAAAWYVGIPRWRAAQWEELQRRLESADLFTAPPAAPPQGPPGRTEADLVGQMQTSEAPPARGASALPARRTRASSYLKRR